MITKKDDKEFEKCLQNVEFVIKVYDDGDVKVGDHCDITVKYIEALHI